jgi:TolB-like protein/class 3 adenylate cyclase/Flp pilus assembly protein TadD
LDYQVAKDRLSDKLAVILHADVAGSTQLVQQDEHLAHERVQNSFRRFGDAIEKYRGTILELRGDALLAEFGRASDAVSATLAFQSDQAYYLTRLKDNLKPSIRVGIAMGEVVMGDGTVTGAGVVLAQRVEQLAEPGGLCITAALHEALPKRMPFDLDNLGEQELKGFDETVRVYRVRLSSGESVPPPQRQNHRQASAKPSWLLGAIAMVMLLLAGGFAYWSKAPAPKEESASLEGMALPLPDKPSIVVLPFINMSDDPSQEYFVDGMTEDLITDLAKVESLFVIARNTAFTYKGKPVVIPEVARELGVKYALEGSVRRVVDRVRINAQLIDGASGGHIWAERYDGSLADVFTLQDKVTGEIISALKITLTPGEQLRRERRGTNNPDAHDAYLKGWQFYRRYTPEDFVEAIPHFERAVELDPDYGQAWAALASVYWITYQKSFGWSMIVNPNRNNFSSWLQTRLKAAEYLEQAMKHPTPLSHQVESQMSWDYRQFDKALNEAEQAVTLDPNDPEGHLAMAWALIYAGRAEEAIASAENGMQLDPYYPAPHLYVLGMAHLMMGKYIEAEAELNRALGLNPENKNLLLPLTVAYVHLDRQEDAKDALKQFSDFFIIYMPKIETYMEWWPFKREVDMRFFGGGLIGAGLCCEEQLEAYINRVRQGGTLEEL